MTETDGGWAVNMRLPDALDSRTDAHAFGGVGIPMVTGLGSCPGGRTTDNQSDSGPNGAQAPFSRPQVLPPRGVERLRVTAADRLLSAGERIASEPPSPEEILFTHTVFCQVALPRSEVFDENGVSATEFMRRWGEAWVSISAGYLDEGRGPVRQTVPYGVLPRLAISYINSYAIREKKREVPIGNSAAEFMQKLGHGNQGGARYAALRRAMHSLAACRLQLGYLGKTFNGQPVEEFYAWPKGSIDQRTLWPGVVLLSESYFESLRGFSVPLDQRALLALKGTALGLDIYTWLAHRLRKVHVSRPDRISWSALTGQFGQEYGNADNFRKEMKRVLRQVLAVYPSARVEVHRWGLEIFSSPPPVAPKVTRSGWSS